VSRFREGSENEIPLLFFLLFFAWSCVPVLSAIVGVAWAQAEFLKHVHGDREEAHFPQAGFVHVAAEG